MRQEELFQHFRVLVVPDFLPRTEIQNLLSEIRQSATLPSQVSVTSKGYEDVSIDERKRRSHTVIPPDWCYRSVESLMEKFRPELQQKFDVPLTRFEGPQFLLYGPDDFFELHRDQPTKRADDPQPRRVSISLFLNDGAHNLDSDEFQGGRLILYCPKPEDSRMVTALTFRAAAGTLIAFLSSLPHEVKPVTSGIRITIVGWFH